MSEARPGYTESARSRASHRPRRRISGPDCVPAVRSTTQSASTVVRRGVHDCYENGDGSVGAVDPEYADSHADYLSARREFRRLPETQGESPRLQSWDESDTLLGHRVMLTGGIPFRNGRDTESEGRICTHLRDGGDEARSLGRGPDWLGPERRSAPNCGWAVPANLPTWVAPVCGGGPPRL